MHVDAILLSGVRDPQLAPLLQAALADLPAFLLAIAALLLLLIGAQVLYARGHLPASATRPLVHASVGVIVAVTPWLLEGPIWIYATASFFVLFNLIAVHRGWLPALHRGGWSRWGTITFPLAAIFALLLAWGPSRSTVYIFQSAFFVLALCDPLATYTGRRWFRARRPFRWIRGKTLLGSIVFFLAACAVLGIALLTLSPGRFTTAQMVLLVLSTASIASAAEAVGSRGWDNLLIVVAVILTMHVAHIQPSRIPFMAGAVLLAVLFCSAAVRLHFLRMDGAVAAGLLGVSLLGFGGWEWAVPPIAFFIGSSLVSRIGQTDKRKARIHSSKGSKRDAGQVLANGAVGWIVFILAIFFPNDVLYWGFVASFAGAAADTWATEIGTLLRGTTRSIFSWKPVEPGESGGVSVEGTFATAIGALTVWAVVWIFGWTDSIGTVMTLTLVVAGGVAGSLVDSLCGATIQAQYLDHRNETFTERSGHLSGPNELVRGFRWLDNDAVNVIGCTTAALVTMALYYALN